MLLPHLCDEARLLVLQLPQQLRRAACPDLPAGHGLARGHHRACCNHGAPLDLWPQQQELGASSSSVRHYSGSTCTLHELEPLLTYAPNLSALGIMPQHHTRLTLQVSTSAPACIMTVPMHVTPLLSNHEDMKQLQTTSLHCKLFPACRQTVLSTRDSICRGYIQSMLWERFAPAFERAGEELTVAPSKMVAPIPIRVLSSTVAAWMMAPCLQHHAVAFQHRPLAAAWVPARECAAPSLR